MLHIDGFNVIRKDRVGKHGGGVLSYVHKTLNHSILSDLDVYLPESLTIKITQPSAKPFITSVVYRPPNSSAAWMNNFKVYIEKCRDMCDDLIIL